MAERRMFSMKIINSDAFLELPNSAQCLYFHLGMRADDDGFINNPKTIARTVGSKLSDLDKLIEKRFLIAFESGVVVIKHWQINNLLRKDRYQETQYTEEKEQLKIKDNKAYTLVAKWLPSGCQEGDERLPQYRLGKDSIGEDSIGEDRLGKDSVKTINGLCATDVARPLSDADLAEIVDAWNGLPVNRIVKLQSGTKRYDSLLARVKQYGFDEVLKAIGLIQDSSFLKGQNKRGWTITFDWFIKPNNFVKVLEGNYTDRKGQQQNDVSDFYQDMAEWAKGSENV